MSQVNQVNRESSNKVIFECKCCGHCCHGVATVSVSEEEQKRMAAYLELELNEFRSKFLVQGKHSTSMKIIDGHCIFYGPDGLCSVHPVKPFHCKRWPLHPSILADEAAWKAIKADCPGFSKDATWEDAKELVRKSMNGTK
ncbi:MAG: YkgJ family cysteine cluster protein [Thermodesulfobacteria bacterium]|nr:YkgJ family cysteine cluster protein [Thermodesulfobacteriota bacterium]